MKNNKIFVCILLLVVCLSCIFAFTGCSFVDSIIDKISPSSGFSITIGENEYTSDVKGLILDKQMTIGVQSDDLFDVKILANTAITNYSFQIDDVNYRWQDMGNYDFSDGFNITLYNEKFDISYANLSTIIYYGLYVDDCVVTTPEISYSVDMFKLVITSGSTSIMIGFNICDTDAHIFDGGLIVDLDPGHIIF